MALHRELMAASIGRPLLSSEVVHHINGDPYDNRIENLMLFPNNGAHIRYHHAHGVRRDRKNPADRCELCGHQRRWHKTISINYKPKEHCSKCEGGNRQRLHIFRYVDKEGKWKR